MAIKIKADVLEMLDAWKAGKAVRAIELGHIHRMKDNPGMCPSIDTSQHVHRDQDRTYAYCFEILEFFIGEGAVFPADFEAFQNVCDVLEEKFRRTDSTGLTAEEIDGAESLAWKTLIVGWKKAIDGHTEANHIEVRRETKPALQTLTTVNGKAL